MFDSILNRAPVPPVRINPDTPPKLEEIINKALEKDRNLSYQCFSAATGYWLAGERGRAMVWIALGAVEVAAIVL
jgi:hypothetical protein